MTDRTDNHREFAARDARQGHIVLRDRKRRAVFIAGLAGFIVLAILLTWLL